MRTTSILLLLWPLLLAGGSAASEESAAPLEMTLELDDARAGYGAPVRFTAVVTNRSKRAVPFFHDRRLDRVFRIELVDRYGIVWGATRLPILVTLSRDPASLLLGLPRGTTSTIQPGGRLRLHFDIEWFVPTNAPKQGFQWPSHLPPGLYTLRLVYAKGDTLVPKTEVDFLTRPGQIYPNLRRRVVPGLFTGRLEATARLRVVAPQTGRMEALSARIRALEEENARLEKVIETVRAALPAR